MLITQPMYKFHYARKYHATSDFARNWLIDPYIAKPPRNKLKQIVIVATERNTVENEEVKAL